MNELFELLTFYLPASIAGILAVYFFARVVFLAFFHAKRDFLRRYMQDGSSEDEGK